MWTRMEKVELALIVGGSLLGLAAPGAPWSMRLGTWVGACAALLLAQGLVRDVVRLAIKRREGASARHHIACLCAESSIGLTGVALALALTLLGVSQPITLGPVGLCLTLATVLGVGFVAKDYVITIRKEKDHSSIIVW